jgi:hypothetical protein
MSCSVSIGIGSASVASPFRFVNGAVTLDQHRVADGLSVGMAWLERDRPLDAGQRVVEP